MNRPTIIIALVLALAACGKKKDTARIEKLAKLCTSASETLRRDASSASVEDFESLLGSTLEACSQACDGEDQKSCNQLDEHLHIVCKSMTGVCDSLCEKAESASLKQTACKLKAVKKTS
jgi:hypothetical protein